MVTISGFLDGQMFSGGTFLGDIDIVADVMMYVSKNVMCMAEIGISSFTDGTFVDIWSLLDVSLPLQLVPSEASTITDTLSAAWMLPCGRLVL